MDQNIEKANCMKLAFEGYICAALFHSIFYIVLSDYADDDSIKVPGTVKITKVHFKKIDDRLVTIAEDSMITQDLTQTVEVHQIIRI